MDSYTASIGEDGEWTGCIAYQGRPMFFKEHMIYTVLGSYPAQYQISKQETMGIRKGGGACVFNQVLYYSSYEGICRYTGSIPQVISHECGDIDATAIGGAGHILYIAKDKDVYTYDTERGQWHHEVADKVDYIYGHKTQTWITKRSAANEVKLYSTEEDGGGYVEWYAVTPLLKISNPDSAYISEIQLRTLFVKGISLKVYVNYDEGSFQEVKTLEAGSTWRDLVNDRWEEVATLTWAQVAGSKQGVFPYTIHIRLKRSTTCRIKLVGKGDIQLISLTKHWRLGSDSTWK